MLEALAAVVGNRLQRRATPFHCGKIIHHGVADTAVQAALALARRVHVPRTELLREQPFATNFIAICARSYWTIRPNGLQNLPEVILRVAIVLLGGQRRRAGETAKDQQARLAANERRQAGQHGSRPVITHVIAHDTSALSRGSASSALALVALANASAGMPRRLATCCAMRGNSPGSLRPWR